MKENNLKQIGTQLVLGICNVAVMNEFFFLRQSQMHQSLILTRQVVRNSEDYTCTFLTVLHAQTLRSKKNTHGS